MTSAPGALVMLSGASVLPPAPSRATLCTAPFVFQGLGPLVTEHHGTLDYLFDVSVGWLTPRDRQAIYALKRAAGSKVIAVAVSSQYSEAGQAYATVPGYDFSQNWPALTALLEEMVREGFYVRLFLAGDGQGAGPGYNDPVGWTYGYQWVMDHLSVIVEAVGRYAPYVQFYPGFDGIIGYDERTQTFGPWSLENLNTYLVALRRLLPTCVSGVEVATGPLGGILTKFLSQAARDALDLLSHEFPAGPPYSDLQWQVADRALGPAFVRPSDMPPGDDPDAPFGPTSAKWSLAVPTSRGPIYAEAMEYALFEQAHHRLPAPVAQQRAYYRAMGYRLVA